MDIPFYKFDGAGNDFILLDVRTFDPQLTTEQIARMCHRRFGIGADGLMTLGCAEGFDFEMRYYNCDGKLGSMCGNGGRCITAFAYMLVIKQTQDIYHFRGFDGPHDAQVLMYQDNIGIVRLGMKDVLVSEVYRCLDGWFLDTGSPHYVQRVVDLEHYDVLAEGRRLRNCTTEFPNGTNVDFIETLDDGTLFVRTFERGVEDETWACGTGVTASAIVSGNGKIRTRGGDFKVTFTSSDSAYTNVKHTGPVALNFSGVWKL